MGRSVGKGPHNSQWLNWNFSVFTDRTRFFLWICVCGCHCLSWPLIQPFMNKLTLVTSWQSFLFLWQKSIYLKNNRKISILNILLTKSVCSNRKLRIIYDGITLCQTTISILSYISLTEKAILLVITFYWVNNYRSLQHLKEKICINYLCKEKIVISNSQSNWVFQRAFRDYYWPW